jgi:hypothetical protein
MSICLLIILSIIGLKAVYLQEKADMTHEFKPWSVPPELIHKITPETVDFYLREAEQLLNEENGISRNITDRAYRILSVLIAVLSALIAFLFSADFTCKQTAMAIIAMTACFIVLPILIYLIAPRKYYTLGSEPKRFVTEVWINDTLKHHHQINALKINKIGLLQTKITHTAKLNGFRLVLLKIALIILSVTFLIETVTAFVL